MARYTQLLLKPEPFIEGVNAMPSVKSRGVPSKSAFVRSQPRNLSAREIVERGKRSGIELTEKYVYVIRSNEKRKVTAKSRAKRPGRARTRSIGRGKNVEAQFRRLAIEMGLARAEQVLADTKKKVASIIAGTGAQ